MYEQVIVIPTYQPSNKLITLIDELIKHFSKIVVVDDGSGIEYSSLIQLASDKNCVVLKHAVNQGKGRALKTAFNYCLNTHGFAEKGCITVDGDGQHIISDIVRVADELETTNNAVIFGYRQFDDKTIPLRSRFGNNISRLVYKWACGIDLKDTQTGLRGIPYSYLEIACAVEGERYEYETNMLISIKDHGYGTIEIPIETIYEENNKESHFRPILDSVKIYFVIIKYSLSSIVSVVIDYIVFAGLMSVGVSILSGIYLSRICSSLVNFLINRNVVFKYRGNIIIQFLKYAGLVFLSGTVSGLAIKHISEYLGIAVLVCKIIVETILFFVNYYVQSRFIFIKE